MLKRYFSTMLFQIYDALIKDLTKNIQKPDKNDIQKYVCDWIDSNITSIVENINMVYKDFFVYTSDSFADFVCSALNSVFSKYKNPYQDDQDKAVGQKLCITFAALVNDWLGVNHIVNEYMLQINIISEGRNTDCCNELRDLSAAMKEVICDIVMINCLGLQPSAYFALIIISMLNQNIDQCDEFNSVVRFGQILAFYDSKSDNGAKYNILDQQKNIMQVLYHLDYQYYADKKDEIEKIIDSLAAAIIKYDSEFNSYNNDFSQIIHCYPDLSKSKNITDMNDDIYTECKTLFGIFEKLNDTFNFYSNPDESFAASDTTNNTKVHTFDATTSIELINMLIPQLSLSQIKNFRANLNKKDKSKTVTSNNIKIRLKTAIPVDPITKTDICISPVLNIEEAINVAKQVLLDDEHPNEKLWYRGQCNANWGASPSLFRKKCSNYNLSLLNAYELFRADSCCTSEIQASVESKADWIACMQHYLVPTHFLDFSEQPLPALYFALENYFDKPCIFCDDAIPDCTNPNKKACLENAAAVFVLNPFRLNRLTKDINKVPNLSTPYNERQYANYLLNYKCKTKNTGKTCPTIDLFKYPPMAIITSQLNNRIIAQKGHFVAYDLRMNISENQSNLLNLYGFQNKCLSQKQILKRKCQPFMCKIIIGTDMKESVAQTLNAYGIYKSSFYPELANIGRDITKRIFP